MAGTIWEERYAIVPQMRVYDQLPSVLAPYVTAISKPNFRSEVLNTDSCGFRISHGRNGLIDSERWWRDSKRAIVLGGSFAFGVGASSDRHTLASGLNALTPYSFLNLGIRAANSTQELIASIPFLDSAERIIVCSGINNLVVTLQSTGKNELYGPVFAEEAFEALSPYSLHELTALVRARLDAIGLRMLLGEVGSRILNKLLRAKRSRHIQKDEATPGALLSDTNLMDVAGKALKRQRRDLSIIAKTIAPHGKLIFVAQPFADVSRGKPCLEEQRLFDLTDGLQGAHWHILKSHLSELWPSYVAELGALCKKEGIEFVNLNTHDFRGWTYVDRVHMTDEGYRQASRRIAEGIS